MSHKINLELPCEISEDQNSITFRGVVVAEFVESNLDVRCNNCVSFRDDYCYAELPCFRSERTDSRNGHWVAVQGDGRT